MNVVLLYETFRIGVVVVDICFAPNTSSLIPEPPELHPLLDGDLESQALNPRSQGWSPLYFRLNILHGLILIRRNGCCI